MRKIDDLHQFIVGLNLFDPVQMKSDVDELIVSPSGRDAEIQEQIIVAELDYTAVYYIERYPHGQIEASVLFAQVSAWLLENDTERTEDIIFRVVTDVLDTQIADIEFSVPFNEQVVAREDADGSIELNGVRYALL